MIVLSTKLRRRPDLDVERFEARCRQEWLPAVQAALGELGAERATLELPLQCGWSPCARSTHGLDAPFDALLRIHWQDADAYAAGAGSPAGMAACERIATVRDAIADRAQSALMLSETLAMDG